MFCGKNIYSGARQTWLLTKHTELSESVSELWSPNLYNGHQISVTQMTRNVKFMHVNRPTFSLVLCLLSCNHCYSDCWYNETTNGTFAP